MDAGIRFALIWLDDDVLEVRVAASNGRLEPRTTLLLPSRACAVPGTATDLRTTGVDAGRLAAAVVEMVDAVVK